MAGDGAERATEAGSGVQPVAFRNSTNSDPHVAHRCVTLMSLPTARMSPTGAIRSLSHAGHARWSRVSGGSLGSVFVMARRPVDTVTGPAGPGWSRGAPGDPIARGRIPTNAPRIPSRTAGSDTGSSRPRCWQRAGPTVGHRRWDTAGRRPGSGSVWARSRQRPSGANRGAQHVQLAGQTGNAPIAGSEHAFGMVRGLRMTSRGQSRQEVSERPAGPSYPCTATEDACGTVTPSPGARGASPAQQRRMNSSAHPEHR